MSQGIEAQASLYFRDGSSDKVYHAQIVQAGDGYVVNFQYGRRGSTLQSGSKTPSPVALAKAQTIFDKLVKEKTGKGYSPGEDGTPFAGTENAGRASGVELQLLNAITREQAMLLLDDDEWGLEQKMDGERRAAHVQGGLVVGINRKRLTVALPDVIAQALLSCLPDDTIVDAEIIGEKLWVFDMLRYAGKDMRDLPCIHRHSDMLRAIPGAVSSKAPLQAVGLHVGRDQKRSFFEKFEKEKAEGVVFKKLRSTYTADRPNSGGDQLKFKFIESATVKILGMNEGVRSARMALFGEDGELIEVGNVTIPQNAALPAAGDLVDVLYLYAYRGGSLYQPVFSRPRGDLEDSAASMRQLKYKVEQDDLVAA